MAGETNGAARDSWAQEERIRHIEAEMKQSYMDYAMSVIIGRALPDVRDGLKPGQRRVLYAMYREGLLPSRAHSKCAGIVGEVLKKYHPHGDQSVYDTLVRMAQDFNLRHPLIDGKGNFGSVDGDPPAAYRYTEARLTPFAVGMMEDIDRDTVDFGPNFDGKATEPEVLPTVVPNLLVNGSDGIAVGMATKIPPHNLREVTAAFLHVIRNQDQPDDALNRKLLELLPGPDFPTGARIHGRHGIRRAYLTGRGVIQVRAVADFEDISGNRTAIVVTEIPYQVNKTRLIEKIADLVKDKRVTGISDIRDESDRRGMRIVLELKRGEEPQVILNNLYRHTPLQSSFGINLLAIADRRPRLFPLLDMLRAFLGFRRGVVRRRLQFELRRAAARLHLLAGLASAVDRLDEVIAWIRTSRNPDEARQRLKANLRPAELRIDRELLARAGVPPSDGVLSDEQAQATLDMRLQRLTRLEREKVRAEMDDLEARISGLVETLGDPARIDAIVAEEAEKAAATHGNDRRTEVVDAATDLTKEDLIPVEDIVVSVTQGGYIKRTALSEYRAQSRGGTGHSGAGIRSGDQIRSLIVGNTHSKLLFISDDGIAYCLKGYQIPEGGKAGVGRAIVNLLQLPKGRQVIAFCPTPDEPGDKECLFFATRGGRVKRTSLAAFGNVRQNGLRAIRIQPGDALLAANLTGGCGEIALATRDGKAIRFPESDVRAMGRDAMGVKGITLGPADEVVSLVTVPPGDVPETSLLTVTRNGYGKMSALGAYRFQRRAGQGVLNIGSSLRNGPVVATVAVVPGVDLIAITAGGKAVRIPVQDFRDIGRTTQGVRVIRVRDDDALVSITRIENGEDES